MDDGIATSHVYTFLEQEYLKTKDKILFALEGSSGAAKTWGGIDFILQYCRINAGANKRITIGRETYRDCMETIAYDFFKRLKMLNWYDQNNHSLSHPQKYNLLGNSIEFTGWSTNGQPSKRQDVLWFNEILESKEENFKQYNQRTNEVVIFDWNPKVTDHWVYNSLLSRPDCKYKHCLMLDNKFLPAGQREEILAYEPTAENIKNGTADEFMWKVYGLGIRTNPMGLIFRHVNWIDTFPEDVGFMYGMDFGFVSDPTALVKYGQKEKDIYLELLCYEPIDSPIALNDFAEQSGIRKGFQTVADSSDKYTSENKGTINMVQDLKDLGWNIRKVKKDKSVIYWLGAMKRYRINIVRNVNAKREAENYKYREIEGRVVNDPIDKFNHFWDASRYAFMFKNQQTGLPIL